MRASGSTGLFQSALEPFFGRFRLIFAEILAGGRLDAGLLRKVAEERAIVATVVAADDTSQSRVRFHRHRVHAEHLPIEKALLGHNPQGDVECFLMHLLTEARANAAETGMVWRRFLDSEAKELLQRERVGASPSDLPLRVEPLEVADHQHPHVDAGRDTRPATLLRVERRAQLLDLPIEVSLSKKLVQLPVERVAGTRRQRRGCDPQRLLAFSAAATHRHGSYHASRGAPLHGPAERSSAAARFFSTAC